MTCHEPQRQNATIGPALQHRQTRTAPQSPLSPRGPLAARAQRHGRHPGVSPRPRHAARHTGGRGAARRAARWDLESDVGGCAASVGGARRCWSLVGTGQPLPPRPGRALSLLTARRTQRPATVSGAAPARLREARGGGPGGGLRAGSSRPGRAVRPPRGGDGPGLSRGAAGRGGGRGAEPPGEASAGSGRSGSGGAAPARRETPAARSCGGAGRPIAAGRGERGAGGGATGRAAPLGGREGPAAA